MTAELARDTAVPVIASGGIGSLDHLRVLRARGVAACVVGRALYDGTFSLEEALDANSEAPPGTSGHAGAPG